MCGSSRYAVLVSDSFGYTPTPCPVAYSQVASALVVMTGGNIVLAGGAQSSNIFWQVGSSATFGTYSVWHGTVMVDQSITFATGAHLTGRAMARIASVTLQKTSITIPANNIPKQALC
jgi:hypothetical protein